MNDLSKPAQDLIMESWSRNTKKTYTPYLKEYARYITRKNIPLQVALSDVRVGIEFLTEVFNGRDVGYTT